MGPDGRLWAGAESAGLSLYDADHNRFQPINARYAGPAHRRLARLLSQASVVALAAGPGGQLWVGTERNGLFALRFDGQRRLVALRRVPQPGPQPGLAYHAAALALDADGRLWVGTMGAGLRCLDTRIPAGAGDLAAALAGAPNVRALHLDRRGDLWVGTDRQVLWVASAQRRAPGPLVAKALPTPYADIQSVLLDSFGRLWVGTTYGLHLWEAAAATGTELPLRLDHYSQFLPVDNDPNSINSERVHQVFEDRNQVLWLAASAGGLNKVDLRQKPFHNLQRQGALAG
ncbi:hypothetical protein AXW84_13700 [Hymenobacter sp. PAMC 26628]|nr:hypothetical protein AXW84_13700 [Hymenobacter sp. PAMC 26628]